MVTVLSLQHFLMTNYLNSTEVLYESGDKYISKQFVTVGDFTK